MMMPKRDIEQTFDVPYPLRVTQAQAAEIEAYRRNQPGGETLPRSQAMRTLIELGLESVRQGRRPKAKARK